MVPGQNLDVNLTLPHIHCIGCFTPHLLLMEDLVQVLPPVLLCGRLWLLAEQPITKPKGLKHKIVLDLICIGTVSISLVYQHRQESEDQVIRDFQWIVNTAPHQGPAEAIIHQP